MICSMMAHYFLAAYAFGKPNPLPALFTGTLAVYFCLLTLADGASVSYRLLYLAQILYFTPTLFVLWRNHAHAPSIAAPDADSDNFPKEETPDAAQ